MRVSIQGRKQKDLGERIEKIVYSAFLTLIVLPRFDAERDIMFTEEKLVGINPIFKGKMGIDATWKEGYPAPLVMSEEIVKKVDERWDSYWK